MGDPFLAYQAPLGNQQQIESKPTAVPNTIQRSIQTNSVDKDISKIGKEASSLGFAGGGAIAAIVVGIVAIALAGTALHEANDHGEDDHRFSTLIVGANNRIFNNSSFSMIGGGTSNTITQDSDNSFIGGGINNNIFTRNNAGGRSAIIAGRDNTINEGGVASVILGGFTNGVSAFNAATLGGQYNNIIETGMNSIILGGGGGTQATGSIITTRESAILGGEDHRILGTNPNVAILGGFGLSTSAGSSFRGATLAGQYNSDGVSELAAGNFGPAEFRFMVGSGDGDENRTNAFSVDNLGNIYYGTTVGASIYFRNSDGGFTGKHFTIQHPIEEEKWLVHSCLEGPEAGVYYRGKDIAPTTIKLPEYATKIADNFTVQITPIGQPRLIASTEVNEDGFFDVMGDGKFHWHVTGRRLEIDPEPNKDSIVVNRWGPYTWNEKV